MALWSRAIVALAVLAALAAPSTAPAHVGLTSADAAGPTAAAKKKRCKKGQVRVRSGRRVSCLPARRVLPKPRQGDPRLLLARSAFGRDWSDVRGRRRKRAQSLPKLVRKLGPRAPRLLATATARGLASIDAQAAAASGARARAAASGCSDVPPGGQRQDSFTSSGGGARATVTTTVNAAGAEMGIELTGNGFTITAELDFGACEPNEVEAPQCPTAAGRLQGEIRYKMRVSVRVSRGGENVWSQSSDVTRRTKLDGFTDVDAKLDFLDIEDDEISTVRLGGSVRDFPPISIRTRISRNTRVNMRSGDYEPGLSDITVTVDMEGLFGADRSDLQDELERRARTDADRQFRSVADKAVSGYRTREDRWLQPNTCARLEFQAARNALLLRPGDAGSFTTTAKALQDGGTSELDARLSNQSGATFQPTRAGGQQARFSYTVPNPTSADRAAVTVEATSKAGVAKDAWEQPIQPPPPLPPPAAYNGTFSGTGDYDENELGEGNQLHASWSGSFRANRADQPGAGPSTASYTFQSGSLQYSYTGHVGDCNVAGNGVINLGAQPDYQNITLIQLFFDSPPRKYQLQVPAPLIAQVKGTKSDCENPDEDGDDFDWSPGTGVPWMAYSPYPGGPVGEDWSISGSGSGNSGPGSPEQSWQWQLTPVP